MLSFARTTSKRLYSTYADIAIIGGGPNGLALAASLASKPSIAKSLKVTLIEGGDLSPVRNWTPNPQTYSNRVSSLTNVSMQFLKEIGAHEHLDLDRTCSMEEIQAWDSLSSSRIFFSSPALARLTENINLQRALMTALPPSVQVLDKTRVSSITSSVDSGHWPVLQFENGSQLRTRLLVGADGPSSPVRKFAKIDSYGWDYSTLAIVATLNHRPHPSGKSRTAFQRFLPSGPIAFLPLSDTTSSLVWSITPPGLAKHLTSTGPDILLKMINAAFRLPPVSLSYLYNRILEQTNLTAEQLTDEISFRENAHSISPHSALSSAFSHQGIPPEDAELIPPEITAIQPGSIASFPLRFNHADSYVATNGRCVLVGDAAHSIHPLAGQGLNLGLADSRALSECILDAVETGSDVGSLTALQPYARARYFENHKIMSICDKLHKLYTTGSKYGPVVWARSTGLEILNELDFVKAGIMGVAGSHSSDQSNPIPGVIAAGIEKLASLKSTIDAFVLPRR